MKTFYGTALIVAALAGLLMAVVPARAGVSVNTKQPVEKLAALQVISTNETASEATYICTAPNSSLATSSGKIGSKQIFTVVDLSGNSLKDGDDVKIRYTPGMGKGKAGDPTKSSYWMEGSDGVKRSHDGDVFKLKQVDSKFVLVTPSGKFVGAATSEGALAVSTNQNSALLLDFVDPKTKASLVAPSDKPASDKTAAPAAATKPAAE
ncbi:MAG TPA: hypothetical protein VMP11_03270 [Verrucomicrobiae bacterium]|nr:hypothetical protein [Verrucomicrobiae bacterium]